MKRVHLRSRVLLLTAAFALTLLGITFALSWQAHVAQKQWARMAGIETQAVVGLDEVIRAQNGFRMRSRPASEYKLVMQLLDRPSLRQVDTRALRRQMKAFERTPTEARSRAVTAEAQLLIDERREEIARRLPMLERTTRDMMAAGLAIAWIVVLCTFAVVQITLRRVVRPVEDLVRAADRIAAGDLDARAPVGGDREIAQLGVAFNAMTDKLREHARTDELTGLPNFRAFRERISEELERARRYPEQFGVLVLDLDHFKKYNDTYGHLAGNGALQRVAEVIRRAVRTVDFPARYGGEEFAVVVPQIEARVLAMIAERVRAGVEALAAPPDGGPVTVSIGAALYPSDGDSLDTLFQIADERLYQAKREGRNRVITPAPAPRSSDRQYA